MEGIKTMLNKLAGIGLRGKRAAEHDEDDAKAEDDNDEQPLAEDDEEDAKAEDDDEHPAAEDDDEEAKAEEDDEEAKAAAKAKRRMAKAVEAATKKATARAHQIAVLCKIAERPELTDECIASGASPSAVGDHLLSLRADGSNAGEIAGQTSPSGSPAAAAAMWDHAAKKNSRFFGHA